MTRLTASAAGYPKLLRFFGGDDTTKPQKGFMPVFFGGVGGRAEATETTL